MFHESEELFAMARLVTDEARAYWPSEIRNCLLRLFGIYHSRALMCLHWMLRGYEAWVG